MIGGHMNRLTIALGQIDLTLGQPDRNLAAVRALAEAAREQGADLLLLPELWGSAYDLERAAAHATSREAGLFAETAQIAREHAIAIAGSLLEQEGSHVYNTATLVDARGNCVGAYRKLHLVPMLEEDRYLSAGDKASAFDTSLGRCALAVCYDLRFPELWRHYALEGARFVLIPAEWPRTRIAHWGALLQARAIENQIFIVATNRVGTSKNEIFGGHSMIVSPWGEILVEGAAEPGLLVAQVDLDEVDRVRERVPVFQNRRPDVYESWTKT